MSYIDKLNALRDFKKMSIRQLSLACDLSESAVKKILLKKPDAQISSIESISTALGTTLAQLFTDCDRCCFPSIADDIIYDKLAELSEAAKRHILWIIENLNNS